MHKPRIFRTAALAALVLSGGCTEQHGISPGTVKQTKFPGQLAAGGMGSGEIMQRTNDTSTASSMPSGTPGIPEGAGGTTSGAAMGGTTPNAAVAGDAPKGRMQGEVPLTGDPARAGAANAPPTGNAGAAPAATNPAANPAPAAAAAPQSDAARTAAQAQKEKEELAASMDDVAKRWRAGAAKNGWATHPATPVAAVAGIGSSGTQEQSRTATPPPVRSEKQGDAAPSEDVKKPKEPGAK